MGKRIIIYSAGLIALYLVVVNASGAGTLIKDTTSGGSSVISAFQGKG